MKSMHILTAAVVFFSVCAGTVWSQAVQLPTYRYFSVGTTVLVPDRGSAYMGGVNSSRSGSTTRGLPGLGPLTRNRSMGSSTGGSSMTVHATIHDFEEMDRMILERAAAMHRNSGHLATEVERQAAGIASNVGRDAPMSLSRIAAEQAPKEMPSESLHSLRQKNLAAARERSRQAQEYFAKAQDCEARGKKGAAKVYYQMAARRAVGKLKDNALARYAYLKGAASGSRVADGSH